MHPPLVEGGKQKHCGELIAALEQCHARGLLARMTGECNDMKHELNMCLRQERLARTRRNLEESAKRREKTRDVWKEIDEDRARA